MAETQARSVLVIEDDSVLIDLFQTILRQAGYEFQAARSAEAASKLVEDRKFDVVVCDLSVAGGEKVFHLVTNMRAQHPEIAILIVTGYTPETIASRIGFHDIELLEKPFSPPELVRRISALLHRKAA